MSYIICEKRKGNPKVNVEVCRRKCKHASQCKPYNEYLGIGQTLQGAKGGLRNHSVSP
ncbi:MAG: hypothetical protein GTO13_09690 [Proteobacteria bacterium]|nr:hypothetical protein [Pseudomonadota bacterium]